MVPAFLRLHAHSGPSLKPYLADTPPFFYCIEEKEDVDKQVKIKDNILFGKPIYKAIGFQKEYIFQG